VGKGGGSKSQPFPDNFLCPTPKKGRRGGRGRKKRRGSDWMRTGIIIPTSLLPSREGGGKEKETASRAVDYLTERRQEGGKRRRREWGDRIDQPRLLSDFKKGGKKKGKERRRTLAKGHVTNNSNSFISGEERKEGERGEKPGHQLFL